MAFHLPKAGAAASHVRSILFSSPLPLSQLFRKQEGLRERQVCKELPQLPSAQAPELLACEEIFKQYIRSLLVKAFLSLALQPLSKGGIHIHILSVMPACTSSLSWGPVELSVHVSSSAFPLLTPIQDQLQAQFWSCFFGFWGANSMPKTCCCPGSTWP